MSFFGDIFFWVLVLVCVCVFLKVFGSGFRGGQEKGNVMETGTIYAVVYRGSGLQTLGVAVSGLDSILER